MAKLPAIQVTVQDLIDEYESKVANIDNVIQAFEQAFVDIEVAATVNGAFSDTVVSKSYIYRSKLESNLLSSAWLAAIKRINLNEILSTKDKKSLNMTLADPPPFTLDNIIASFSDYLSRPRYHILRGLAEVFVDLDPSYKSHSKVRIGVKGLPKRVIISGWGEWFSSHGKDRVRDVINALAVVQGKEKLTNAELDILSMTSRKSEVAVFDGSSYHQANKAAGDTEYKTVDRGVSVKVFGNGNAHIIFDKWAQFDINKALAEFYGEVLPDVDEEGLPRASSTAVAKDLQFYWTPDAVIQKAMVMANIYCDKNYHGSAPKYRILEPSCGDGRILDVIRDWGHDGVGVEYHSGRVAEAKAKGHKVLRANFLEHPPEPNFDRVVMNPPFGGLHYIKHVKHALKFLKPGGVLVAVLPATAHYDHKGLIGEWSDLPVGSFSEVGTNIPTGLLKIVASKV